MPELKKIIVSVKADALERMDELVQHLSDRGMQVDRVLARTGVISGSAADLSALRTVDGVAAVEEELDARLPPRDSPLQ